MAEVTPAKLHAFGAPRRPRPLEDFGIESETDLVGPGPSKGASTFADPMLAPLTGSYHSIPAGTELPEGLGVICDGEDTHHTIYPLRPMPFSEFAEKFLSLPWKREGKKK